MRGGTGMRTSLLAAKWNFSREDAQGRRLKNFVQIRSVSSVDIAYLSQSWPELYWWRRVCYSGDIIAKKDPGFSFPYETNPEFDFDENAESERLAKLQNTWLRELLSRFPYSAWFIQGHLGLLRAVKVEPKFRVVTKSQQHVTISYLHCYFCVG